MIERKITIAGRDVNLCYCFATEIGYKTISGDDADGFFRETADALSATPQQMPDMRHTIQMILSAVVAWYDANRKKPPIKDEDLMYRSTPTELSTALGALIGMRAEFYHVPEPVSDDKQEDDGKNA